MIKYLPLAFVLTLYLFTRLFRISEVPASVYWDEASIGYNAYSITQDLKDEWGEFMPLHFRAFGEFKLPVYIYSTAVFVKLFGLSIFTTRVASVVYGMFVVLFVYLTTKHITKNNITASFAALITTTAPWLFIFTRAGYEAVAGLAFYLAGVYFYLLSEKKPVFLLVSIFFWIVSIYSYNSFRIIVPISLILIIAWTLLKKRRSAFKYLAVSIVIFLVSLVPIVNVTIKDFGGSRFTAIGVQGDTLAEKTVNVSENYLVHFSPQFLFLSGDPNPRSQLPGQGQLFIITLPLILLGLLSVYKYKKTGYVLPVILLLLAPIPAAITREAPHTLRSILMAPMIAIVAAFGLEYLIKIYNREKILLFLVASIYLISFGVYVWKYYTKYNTLTSEHWQYPYKEVFTNNYEGKVFVTDKYAQPYIFALFYNKVDPNYFRSAVKYNPPDKWGFSTVKSFGQYSFGHEDSIEDVDIKIIDRKLNDKVANNIIKFLNNENALYVYEE